MDRLTDLFVVVVPLISVLFRSWSGFQDELAWCAAWLYAATGEQQYLDKVSEKYFAIENAAGGGFSWDSKAGGALLLLYKLTKDEKYANGFKNYIGSWQGMKTTPKGLSFYSQWGANRYAANTAFLALLGADLGLNTDSFRAFGIKNINYILGDCCGGVDPSTNQPFFSYVIGYGNNYPRAPHHRSSSCWGPGNCPCGGGQQAHPLYGAMVGGPGEWDDYTDSCQDYVHTAVATDYNAGFTSGVAAIKQFSVTKRLEGLEVSMDNVPIKKGNLGGRE